MIEKLCKAAEEIEFLSVLKFRPQSDESKFKELIVMCATKMKSRKLHENSLYI